MLGIIIQNPVARYLCFPSLVHKYMLAICTNYLHNGRYFGSKKSKLKEPIIKSQSILYTTYKEKRKM